MSLAPSTRPTKPGFRRGKSFVEEIAAARDDVQRKLAQDEPDTPSDGSVPSLTPSTSAGSLSPISASTPISEVEVDQDVVADSFAFAFDIDGVLIRGGRPIPEAIEAMKVLNGENKYGVKIPYIFLTNGGGKSEEERCGDLSKQLDVVVAPAQFICGHTPMSEMAEKYSTVLVVGGEGEKCRLVAEHYGFKDVVTPGDMIKANSAITPFRKLTPEEFKNSRVRDFSDVTIEAIFVFADSRDWAGDLQIIMDLAMSKGGKVGTLSDTFEEAPPIYFSHSDIVWSAAHDNVRLGMGALRGIVEYTFTQLTHGKTLQTEAFGKPQIGTFEFATRLLKRWRRNEHGLNAAPDTVYFVGDTPESDIRGTNLYNEKASEDWHSILVKTGVYQEGTEPAYKPRVTVNTVLDAVNYGLEREMARRQATNAASDAKVALQTPKLSGLPQLMLDDSRVVVTPGEEAALELVAH